MKPLLIAGHPALEFLDTTMSIRGETIELLGDGRAFLEWLVEVELLDAEAAARLRRRSRSADLDAAAAEARRLRGSTVAWLSRWRLAPDERYEGERRKLNALLARANDYRQLTHRDGRFAITEHHRVEAAGELIAILAAQIADLVASEDPSLVKRCAGESCTLWFVDRTKAHRRRFCSPTACGNREKVAAFRERQRRSSGE
jgi:predicted RNA-binding Zn ribbon-like protein